MAKDRFNNLDLNLLRTFVVLAQEGNMRRAAARLHVTQPAVSHALQRLRHHFEDELFIKVPGGMTPTQFARTLQERLKPVLVGLAEAVNDNNAFNPAELDTTLRIALPPHLNHYIGATLYRRLNRDAPNASVELMEWGGHTPVLLLNGELDVGVNIPFPHRSKELIAAPVGQDSGVMMVHHDHPYKGRSITPEQLSRWGLACLFNPGITDQQPIIQRVLEAHGHSAKIRFRSASLPTIFSVLRQHDYFFPHTAALADSHAPEFRPVQLEVAPHYLTVDMFAYYHRGHQHPAVTLWLVEHLAEALRGYLKPLLLSDKWD
ncbi:transcriptional regulator, LysR family [Ferrimonas balearica DSM 9799]|uniref:Transcriptional regulator, LysR family n=1 Tax=Ferrimonas balearica (strain DSM 9799 / CCM 4581 / KCTC 23876 / PAT) TaxID=550540 RepID=E1SL23_FERBD|nr:LysR family transcriptional regulator [Ferrimonas balearica]ADN74417.1 transcriptional regulator, LysR family [Ferrimonas balearica DSM 9799]